MLKRSSEIEDIKTRIVSSLKQKWLYRIQNINIIYHISISNITVCIGVGNYILEIKGMLLIHWSILFMHLGANLLGLNISSAFNSAITIYILIPILLILINFEQCGSGLINLILLLEIPNCSCGWRSYSLSVGF